MGRSQRTEQPEEESVNPETSGWAVGEFTQTDDENHSDIGEVPRIWLFEDDSGTLCSYYPLKQSTWRKAKLNMDRWRPDPEKWTVYRFRILGDKRGKYYLKSAC